jgi:hypothetical protein
MVMQKLIVTVLLVSFVIQSCKKSPTQVPRPQPEISKFSVTVDTVGTGAFASQINPVSGTVRKGDSVRIVASLEPGWRINTVSSPGIIIDSATVVYRNVASNLVVNITFTDSLTATKMNTMKAAITSGKWYDSKYAFRTTGPRHKNDAWQPLKVAGYAKPYYNIYFADGTYDESTATINKGTWTLSYNGKSFTTIDNATGEKSINLVLELTKDAFTFIIINQHGQGEDFEDFATHIQLL